MEVPEAEPSVTKEGLHHVTPVVLSLPRPPHKDTAIGSHPQLLVRVPFLSGQKFPPGKAKAFCGCLRGCVILFL